MHNNEHGCGYVAQYYCADKLVYTYQKNIKYVSGGEILKIKHESRMNATNQAEVNKYQVFHQKIYWQMYVLSMQFQALHVICV